MNGFQPELSAFPKILSQGMTKREIASRAMRSDSMKTVRQAYDVRPHEMKALSALYVLQPEGEQVSKIGIANNPFVRVQGVQTGSWKPLSIKALFWFPRPNDAASVEFHALKLAGDEGLRLCGEWVNLEPDEAVGLVLTATDATRPMTDCYGVISEWFPEIVRQKDADEEAYYGRRPRANLLPY